MTTNKYFSILVALALPLLATSCADLSHMPSTIDESQLKDDFISVNYEYRTWYPPNEVPFDPIGVGKRADIPVNSARTKIIGPTYQDALDSLAAKIWMIENAEYTADLVYYIFKRDTVGYAILGALCNAVKRGVDVRIMVDSLGSIHTDHNELRALETCAEQAGYMKDKHGNLTGQKARVQVVIINAISNVFVRANRRAHDKIIVVDGHVREKALVMTGGRNISVSYYGIHDDGSPDPTAYQDVEIILRPNLSASEEQDTVGDVTVYYYTMLFLHAQNKRLYPLLDDAETESFDHSYEAIYKKEREKAQEKLAFVKNIPEVKASLEKMSTYINEGYRESWVRLAHELGNLTNPKAVTGVEANLERNPNSIQTVASKILDVGNAPQRLRIVSPYYFVARYFDEEGNEIFDGVKEVRKWLSENPDATVELITNSVLTSDNFMAQAVIDMDTAPRLLLSPELLETWLSGLDKGELNPELVESEEWKQMIDNPRIKIYETGKMDSVLIGGDKHYGKLHAKYLIADGYGFVGTTNFDYRSRLFNNEFGFYFKDDDLYQDLVKIFDDLKSKSYRWGTPEWLEMRKKVMEQKGMKASSTRKQRGIFKTLRSTGMEWLF
ncbi:phospholipase D-like domain-containing protein [Kaarinaea lacus]